LREPLPFLLSILSTEGLFEIEAILPKVMFEDFFSIPGESLPLALRGYLAFLVCLTIYLLVGELFDGLIFCCLATGAITPLLNF